MRSRSLFAPLVIIAVGVLFLLSNLGLVPALGPLFARWWPVLLIVVGLYQLTQRERKE